MKVRIRTLGSLCCLFGLCLLLLLGASTSGTQRAAASGVVESRVFQVNTPTYSLAEGHLSAPGLDPSSRPGAPMLPVHYEIVDLPDTGTWSVTHASSGIETISLDGSTLSSVPAPATPHRQPSTDPTIFQNSFVTVADHPDATIYGNNALYPAQPLIVGKELWQRGKRFVVIEVYPFQYNPVQNKLQYHPSIDVSVTIEGVTGEALQGSPDYTVPAQNEQAESLENAVRIYTSDRGIYHITYADLQSAGVAVDTLDPQSFHMSLLGSSVAIDVTGESDGSFDPGDEIVFYAQPYVGRYMTENVYWLRYNGAAGPRIGARGVPMNLAATPIDQYRSVIRIEDNEIYKSDLIRPKEADHWYDSPLLIRPSSPVQTRTYTFTLDSPVLEPTETGALFSLLSGFLNVSGVNPDKTARLEINGQQIAHYLWEGETEYSATESVSMDWFVAGGNQLKLISDINDLIGSVNSSYVYPDYFELTYSAYTEVKSGTQSIFLNAMVDGAERVRVTNFPSGTGNSVRVFDVRTPDQPVELSTIQVETVAGTDRVDFWDEPLPNPSYTLSTPSDYRSPTRIELDQASSLHSTSNSADYIAIVPEMVWEAPAGKLGIDDLLNHRQSEGFDVAKVNLQDIYDEWSYGRVTPEAIRDFLSYAYFNWNSGSNTPPTYVLLVGDGHYDFKEYQPNYEFNLIPPYLDNVDPFIHETASDNLYVTVDGPADILPDMSIGRLTAQAKYLHDGTIVDPSFDLDVMVRKIIGYETTAPDGVWQKDLTFVTGAQPDPAGNFWDSTDDVIATSVPDAYDINRLYFKSVPELDTTPEMRDAIHAAFDNDTLMLQWMGHGSPVNWDGSSVYNILDTDGYGGYTPLVTNEQFPLTVAYACNSSYFINRGKIYNHYNSLGESMLRGIDRGSVADIGPTGEHVVSAITTMNKQIASQIFVNREARVGLALDAAKYDYVGATSAFHDILDTTILLGDPATKLRLPAMPRLINSTLTLNTESVYPGSTGNYSVKVTNDGDAPAEQVAIEVDYDQSKVTVLDAGGAFDNGDTLIWNLGTVPVGTISRSFSVEYDATLPVGSIVDTSATITAQDQLPVVLNRPATMGMLPIATPTSTATSVPPTATATSVPPSPTATTTVPPITPTATATSTAVPPSPTPTATATATPPSALYLPFIMRLSTGASQSGTWALYGNGYFDDNAGQGGRWYYNNTTQGLVLSYSEGGACDALLLGKAAVPGLFRGRSFCRDGSGVYGVWQASVSSN